MGLNLALLIEDTHVPYEHKKAYQLMLNVARDQDIHTIVIKGDFADFYSVSRFDKDPRIGTHLMAEVEAVNHKLDELDFLFPRAKKIYVEGNHENRLENYIITKCPALFGITEISRLFKLNERPLWQFVPYKSNQAYQVLGSKLYVRHEPGANNAKLAANKAIANITYGHIHRREMSSMVGLDGEEYIAYCAGWMGDKRNDLVFDYVSGHHQWNLGFSLVYVDDETKDFYVQIVPIVGHDKDVSCVVNGKLYKL